jgi:hypothetical protein
VEPVTGSAADAAPAAVAPLPAAGAERAAWLLLALPAAGTAVRLRPLGALAAREPGCFRAFCAPLDCWLEWTVDPGEQGFLILSRDVTRMVKTERRVRRALAAVQASRSDLLTQPSGDEGEPQRADAEFVRDL